MDYNKLDDVVKNKMFDLRLKEVNISPYQEQFRYIIARDFWINKNKNMLGRYYKMTNKSMRKQKINKIKERL